MLQIKSCADTVWKAWQGEIQPQNKFIGLWFSTLCWTGAAIKFHSNITTSIVGHPVQHPAVIFASNYPTW
jgi:hypothetical protein